MINETQIREVVDNVLSEEGLKNFIKIFEKEHNIFRGSHEKMAVPPVIVENYYTSEYLNERLWDIDGDNLYYDKGWVGIGKKPALPLDVLGDVSLDGAAFFNESGLDKDFRIKSLNNAYAFFLNAEDDLIGIMESLPTARVHINSVGGSIPALNLESGAEGELVTPDEQQLRIGHWNAETETFTERMKMDDAGKIFISYLTNSGVLFAGAGGEIKEDFANLYWNNTNKRLGIGKSPSNVLDVDGIGTTAGWGGTYGGIIARFRCTQTPSKHTAVVIDAVPGYDAVLGFSESGGVRWALRHNEDDHAFQLRYHFGVNRVDLAVDTAGNVTIPTGLTTVVDLSVSAPVNIYNLSHDLFADYVAARHYDWTNETHDFLTTGVFALGTGTPPPTSPADRFQMYSADIAADHAACHIRNENDTIIKLYQQALISDPTGGVTQDSEARTAINAVLDLLENNGLMANA